jgi:serine/threonine protein kinase
MFGRKPVVVLGERKLRLERKIAEGGFSIVHLVKQLNGKEKDRLFAMKVVVCQGEEQVQGAEREIEAHHGCIHPHILELIDSGILPLKSGPGPRKAYFLFENFAGGALSDTLIANGAPDFSVVLRLFRALVEGTLAFHQNGLRHCDIKPHNILLSSPLPTKARAEGGHDAAFPRVVLMDLGSCAPLRLEITNRMSADLLQERAASESSAPYRPPELFHVPSQCVVDGSADVWSIGATLHFMAFGSSPFESKIEGLQILNIMSGTVRFPACTKTHEKSEQAVSLASLVRSMLQPDPRRRLRLEQALEVVMALEGGGSVDQRLPEHLESMHLAPDTADTSQAPQQLDVQIFCKAAAPVAVAVDGGWADFSALGGGVEGGKAAPLQEPLPEVIASDEGGMKTRVSDLGGWRPKIGGHVFVVEGRHDGKAGEVVKDDRARNRFMVRFVDGMVGWAEEDHVAVPEEEVKAEREVKAEQAKMEEEEKARKEAEEEEEEVGKARKEMEEQQARKEEEQPDPPEINELQLAQTLNNDSVEVIQKEIKKTSKKTSDVQIKKTSDVQYSTSDEQAELKGASVLQTQHSKVADTVKQAKKEAAEEQAKKEAAEEQAREEAAEEQARKEAEAQVRKEVAEEEVKKEVEEQVRKEANRAKLLAKVVAREGQAKKAAKKAEDAQIKEAEEQAEEQAKTQMEEANERKSIRAKVVAREEQAKKEKAGEEQAKKEAEKRQVKKEAEEKQAKKDAADAQLRMKMEAEEVEQARRTFKKEAEEAQERARKVMEAAEEKQAEERVKKERVKKERAQPVRQVSEDDLRLGFEDEEDEEDEDGEEGEEEEGLVPMVRYTKAYAGDENDGQKQEERRNKRHVQRSLPPQRRKSVKGMAEREEQEEWMAEQRRFRELALARAATEQEATTADQDAIEDGTQRKQAEDAKWFMKGVEARWANGVPSDELRRCTLLQDDVENKRLATDFNATIDGTGGGTPELLQRSTLEVQSMLRYSTHLDPSKVVLLY